jgi:hypothetical protein
MEYANYIHRSLDLNLFFLRIMKEHSFFLQIGFMPKNEAYSREAAQLSKRFEELLGHATHLSSEHISRQAIESGEFVTQYTLDAERATQEYTGIPFNFRITQEEMNLAGQCNRLTRSVLPHRSTI